MSFQNRIDVPPAGGCLFPVLDRGNRAAVDAAAALETFALCPGRVAVDHFDRPGGTDRGALPAADAFGVGVKSFRAHAGVI